MPREKNQPWEFDADAEPDPALFSPNKIRAGALSKGSVQRVLVVDDSTMMRRLVGAVVAQLGHEVVEAKDGNCALELARQHQPDLIILDIKMPDKDGLQVLHELRADPSFARTPVIMLTVESDREAIGKALSGKASDYLIKPVGTAELRKRITRYLPDNLEEG